MEEYCDKDLNTADGRINFLFSTINKYKMFTQFITILHYRNITDEFRKMHPELEAEELNLNEPFDSIS